MARQPSTKSLSNPDQIGLRLPSPRRIPLEFTIGHIKNLKSESDAINFSVSCSGYESKEIPMLFGIDEGNWSRITKSGDRYFPHDRRNEFMDFVGNEVLLMYAIESRGYDWATLRRHRTEIEEENERLRLENEQLKHDREVERAAFASMLQGRK